MNQRLILPRVNRDETTFAVVEWSGVPRAKLLEALRSALTQWRETAGGRAAWQESCGDFNIGDLSDAPYEREPLRDILVRHGITYLNVETYCDCEPVWGWNFDTALMEEPT
jgi:hypothetical protein